jgi:hypothetical protein
MIFSAEPAAFNSPTLKSGFYEGFHEDKHAARKLLLKIDLRLIPILGCRYLFSFLDRSNIANARIEGHEKVSICHLAASTPASGSFTCLLPSVRSQAISSLAKNKAYRLARWHDVCSKYGLSETSKYHRILICFVRCCVHVSGFQYDLSVYHGNS